MTGMEVKATVGDSLLIASSTADTAKADDSAFTKGINQSVTGILNPVSTIDAADANFYYTYDAKANGEKATANSVIPYTAVTTEGTHANKVWDGTTEYEPYVDYVFEIKAINSDASNAKELRLTKLNLLYDGAAVTEHTYRIAIFEQDENAGKTAYNTRPTSANVIFAPTGFTYFDSGKAVDSPTTRHAVDPVVNSSAWTKAIPAATTDYTQLTVRLWLEGEDTDCYSSQFLELTKEWTLDLKFELANGSSDTDTTAAVTSVGSTANVTATASGLTGTVTFAMSGESAASYQWYTDNLGDLPDTQISGATSASYTATATTDAYCVVTTAKGTTYRTNTIHLALGG